MRTWAVRQERRPGDCQAAVQRVVSSGVSSEPTGYPLGGSLRARPEPRLYGQDRTLRRAPVLTLRRGGAGAGAAVAG